MQTEQKIIKEKRKPLLYPLKLESLLQNQPPDVFQKMSFGKQPFYNHNTILTQTFTNLFTFTLAVAELC